MLLACNAAPMKHLQIKNVPPEIHDAVRVRAADSGMTMSEYLLDLLRRDLAVPTQRQWLEQLSQRSRVVTDTEVLDALDVVREQRDEELLTAVNRR